MTTQTPVFIPDTYAPTGDAIGRKHLTLDGVRTKCGESITTASSPEPLDGLMTLHCRLCPDVWPRLGDGFATQEGLRTAVFSREFYEAHMHDEWNSTSDYARTLGLTGFDTAVPHPWCEDVARLTGVWPTTLGFVTYDKEFTEPVPLTIAGYMLLGWYRQARAFESAQRSIATDRR
jgi:hypothetical protein